MFTLNILPSKVFVNGICYSIYYLYVLPKIENEYLVKMPMKKREPEGRFHCPSGFDYSLFFIAQDLRYFAF